MFGTVPTIQKNFKTPFLTYYYYISLLWCFSFPDFRLTASIKRQEGVSLCENCCETIVSLCVPRSVQSLYSVIHLFCYSVAVFPALMLRCCGAGSSFVLYRFPFLSRHLNIKIIDFRLVVTRKQQKREWKIIPFYRFSSLAGSAEVVEKPARF